ncbi:MAG: hypothetical protein HGA85_07585 [Nanoarchaeota archaeon]|nr:hypothetical protein [Nanoarchaeota archaeon]
MEHIRVSGTNRDCGYQLGKAQSAGIKDRARLYKASELALRKKKELESIHHLCRKVYPQYVDELSGISSGSGVGYMELLALNCLELHGCSSIAIPGKHPAIYHNEDGWSSESKAGFAMATFRLPTHSFTAFIYPGELPGAAFGWNSFGLIMTVNELSVLSGRSDSLPKVFVARSILDCKDAKEAISKIALSKNDGGFHYYLYHTGEIFSIEQSGDRVSARKIMQKNCHTNHYIHDMFTGHGTRYMESRSRLRQLRDSSEPLEALFSSAKRYPVYCEGTGKSRTLATVAFYPNENRAIVFSSIKEKIEFNLTI